MARHGYQFGTQDAGYHTHLLGRLLVPLELVPLVTQPVPQLPPVLLLVTEPQGQLLDLIQQLLLLLWKDGTGCGHACLLPRPHSCAERFEPSGLSPSRLRLSHPITPLGPC